MNGFNPRFRCSQLYGEDSERLRRANGFHPRGDPDITQMTLGDKILRRRLRVLTRE